MNQDFAILASVAAAPAHPFAVLDHLQAMGVKVTRSTVYRRVDALVAEGLLEAAGTPSVSGPPRRILRLTDRGRQQASRIAAQVMRDEPLESPFFALALTCVDDMETEAMLDLLRARLATTARKLTMAERALARAGATQSQWQLAGQERQVAHLRADIMWLQSMMGRSVATDVAPLRARNRIRATG